MTQEERDLLMAKAIDTPQALTDKEIECFMHDRELREMYNTAVMLKSVAAMDKAAPTHISVKAGESPKTVRRFPRWAAAIAFIICLGAVAATIGYRFAEPRGDESPTSSTVSIKTRGTDTGKPILLSDSIVFENQPLAEIAKTVAETFACRVVVADKELETLRLYMTLAKGSTAADFVQLIDAYDMLSATIADGTIEIKKGEGKR